DGPSDSRLLPAPSASEGIEESRRWRSGLVEGRQLLPFRALEVALHGAAVARQDNLRLGRAAAARRGGQRPRGRLAARLGELRRADADSFTLAVLELIEPCFRQQLLLQLRLGLRAFLAEGQLRRPRPAVHPAAARP